MQSQSSVADLVAPGSQSTQALLWTLSSALQSVRVHSAQTTPALSAAHSHNRGQNVIVRKHVLERALGSGRGQEDQARRAHLSVTVALE